jgi:hypothetical protein
MTEYRENEDLVAFLVLNCYNSQKVKHRKGKKYGDDYN